MKLLEDFKQNQIKILQMQLNYIENSEKIYDLDISLWLEYLLESNMISYHNYYDELINITYDYKYDPFYSEDYYSIFEQDIDDPEDTLWLHWLYMQLRSYNQEVFNELITEVNKIERKSILRNRYNNHLKSKRRKEKINSIRESRSYALERRFFKN